MYKADEGQAIRDRIILGENKAMSRNLRQKYLRLEPHEINERFIKEYDPVKNWRDMRQALPYRTARGFAFVCGSLVLQFNSYDDSTIQALKHVTGVETGNKKIIATGVGTQTRLMFNMYEALANRLSDAEEKCELLKDDVDRYKQEIERDELGADYDLTKDLVSDLMFEYQHQGGDPEKARKLFEKQDMVKIWNGKWDKRILPKVINDEIISLQNEVRATREESLRLQGDLSMLTQSRENEVGKLNEKLDSLHKKNVDYQEGLNNLKSDIQDNEAYQEKLRREILSLQTTIQILSNEKEGYLDYANTSKGSARQGIMSKKLDFIVDKMTKDNEFTSEIIEETKYVLASLEDMNADVTNNELDNNFDEDTGCLKSLRIKKELYNTLRDKGRVGEYVHTVLEEICEAFGVSLKSVEEDGVVMSPGLLEFIKLERIRNKAYTFDPLMLCAQTGDLTLLHHLLKKENILIDHSKVQGKEGEENERKIARSGPNDTEKLGLIKCGLMNMTLKPRIMEMKLLHNVNIKA